MRYLNLLTTSNYNIQLCFHERAKRAFSACLDEIKGLRKGVVRIVGSEDRQGFANGLDAGAASSPSQNYIILALLEL